LAIVIDKVSETAANSMQKGKTTKITASSMDDGPARESTASLGSAN
jgi:hypothetical protein